jgi:UDP-glucose 4-epimerase
MKKKVLVMGGAGFIGLGIVRYLAEQRDCEITLADRFAPGQEDEDLRAVVEAGRVKVIRGDFCRPEEFRQLDEHYDDVYMLASIVGVNKVIEHPEETIRVNTSLILNTLEWVRGGATRNILFSSSSECYAGTTDAFGYPVPTGEAVPLCVDDIRHPRFTYAITKMLGESGFFAYASSCGFRCTVVRYQNIYGPRMGFKHAIPHIVERFWKGENPVRIYGARQTRAFCFATDAAEGTVRALERTGTTNEIYHIGAMDEVTVETLTKTIGGIMGYSGAYEEAPTYPGSVSRRCPDIAKATRDLGYAPRVSLREGLERTVSWYQEFFRSGQVIHDGGFKAPGELRN